MRTKGTIVVAGSIAQKPWHGGHTWVILQYVLGFQKLGWDVLFVDRLESDMCTDRDGRHCGIEDSVNLQYFLSTMRGFKPSAYALLYGEGASIGASRHDIIARTSRAALLLNVMGFLRDPEILGAAQTRVCLDIDPGFGQMWQELGLHTTFQNHHYYATIGENVGQAGCSVPTCGLNWITTHQPIQLDYWQPQTASRSQAFTTVATWRGAYGPLPFQGKTYGLRVHEFRKFAALPKLTTRPFEVALDIDAADATDRALLETNGWLLADPRRTVADPWSYRSYIQGSSAEFMVAKNMYVQTQSGWFSDRSICYLASGKPVLVQDTGLRHLYPLGEGVLAFSTVEEAVSGVQELTGHYDRHARAARQLAIDYFDSDKVLRRLLQQTHVN